MTDEERGPEQASEANHWELLAGELGADYDVSRAAPRQIAPVEERPATTPAAETSQPSQPATSAWFGEGISDDIDQVNSAHAADNAAEPTADTIAPASEQPLLAAPKIDEPASTEVSPADPPTAVDDPIPTQAWEIEETADIVEVPTEASFEEESFGAEPIAQESMFDEVDVADSVIEEAEEEEEEAEEEEEELVAEVLPPNAWAIDEPAETPTLHVKSDESDVVDATPAAPPPEPTREIPPTPEMQPVVSAPVEEPVASDSKHVSHWNKLAGFLGLGGAKSPPKASPTSDPASTSGQAASGVEQAKPESAGSIFEDLTSDPDIVKSRASQQFVDSIFGTDSSKVQDPESADSSEAFDDSVDESAHLVDDEERDAGEISDEEDAEHRPRRGRRRRGSRGRGRGRARGPDRAEADASTSSDYNEVDQDEFDDAAEAGGFGDEKEDVATGAYQTPHDASETGRQGRRNIPSWVDCVGVIVAANMENHKKAGNESRPKRRRRRGGNNTRN